MDNRETTHWLSQKKNLNDWNNSWEQNQNNSWNNDDDDDKDINVGGSWIGTGSLWTEISESKSEMIIQSVTNSIFAKNYSQSELETIRKNAVPNTVEIFQTIPANNIHTLSISSDLFGISIEPSAAENFEIAYVGVKDKNIVTLEAQVKSDGTLFVSVKGKENQIHYISNTPDNKVNTIRIQVPSKILKAITIEDKCSNTALQELFVPVTASTINGIIQVKSDTLSSDYSLKCINGTVWAIGKTINGDMNMETVNGDAKIKADILKGTTTLSCVNGDIKVTVNEITDSLDVKTTNGDIQVSLEKKPENFTFIPSFRKNSAVSLPADWKNGYTIGNGHAKLKITSRANSDVTLKVKGFH